MDDSIIERLRAALDQAQHLAENAEKRRGSPWLVGAGATVTNSDGRQYVTGYTTSNGSEVAEHIAAWSPARVLKLIERDRALLAEYEAALAAVLEAMRMTHVDDHQPYPKARAAADALVREFDRVAEFWLGSTE